jgi:prophage regulatory protein
MSEEEDTAVPQGQDKQKKLLRMEDLKADYGLVPATVYRWIGEGHFPAPVNIGANSVAWHIEEIEAWRWSRPRAKIRRHKSPSPPP